MTFAWFNIGGRKVYRRVPQERVSKRSDLATPMIKSDRIAPVQCQADGKYYDSMSALNKAHERHGMIPVGEFNPDAPKRPDIKRFDEKDAVQLYDKATSAINNGFKPEVHDSNF